MEQSALWQSPWMTQHELAAVLHISPRTIRTWSRQGKIPTQNGKIATQPIRMALQRMPTLTMREVPDDQS